MGAKAFEPEQDAGVKLVEDFFFTSVHLEHLNRHLYHVVTTRIEWREIFADAAAVVPHLAYASKSTNGVCPFGRKRLEPTCPLPPCHSAEMIHGPTYTTKHCFTDTGAHHEPARC